MNIIRALHAGILPLLMLIGPVLFAAGCANHDFQAAPDSYLRLVYVVKDVVNLDDASKVPSMAGAVRVVGARLEAVGCRLSTVHAIGDDRIEIRVAGPADDPRVQAEVARVKQVVWTEGFLELKIVADKIRDREEADFDRILREKADGKAPYTPEFRWYPFSGAWHWYKDGSLDHWGYVYWLDKDRQAVEVLVKACTAEERVTEADIKWARASSREGDPKVEFSLYPAAAARFSQLTRPENRDRRLAIILGGVIKSAPVLRATLSTGGIIEGFENNVAECDAVVMVLNYGLLWGGLKGPVVEEWHGAGSSRAAAEHSASGPSR